MKLTEDQKADLGDQLNTMLDDLGIVLPYPVSTIKRVIELIAKDAIEPATGDRVRIVAGEFAPWNAVIVEHDSGDYFLVRMDPAPGSHHVTGPTVRVNRIEIEVIE